VRIRVDTGLAASQLPAGYQRRDDIYTSPGYATAENRVDLEVSQTSATSRYATLEGDKEVHYLVT